MVDHPPLAVRGEDRTVAGSGGDVVADQHRIGQLGERPGRAGRLRDSDGVRVGVEGVAGVEQPERAVRLDHERSLDQASLPRLVLLDQPQRLADQLGARGVQPLDRDPGVDADPVAVVLPVEIALTVRRRERMGVDRTTVVGLADQGPVGESTYGPPGESAMASPMHWMLPRSWVPEWCSTSTNDRRPARDLGCPHVAAGGPFGKSGSASGACSQVIRSVLRRVWMLTPFPLVAKTHQTPRRRR